jgi:CRISPR-associated protein Cas2
MSSKNLVKFNRYIVIYDICEEETLDTAASKENIYHTNKRRGKIARLLLEHGIRTQKSVYEIIASEKEIKKLVGLFKKISEKGDKIYIYPISESIYKRTIRVGKISPMIEHFFI